jgi:hypothetical protein
MHTLLTVLQSLKTYGNSTLVDCSVSVGHVGRVAKHKYW